MAIRWAGALAALASACGGETTEGKARVDSGDLGEGGTDARPPGSHVVDAGPADAPLPVDAAPPETGVPPDPLDASSGGDVRDVSRPDSGEASTPEASLPLPDRFAIAEGQAGPTGIAVNRESVYFANRDEGTVVRCPITGCGTAPPDVVVSGQDHPFSVALDATHLYWITGWMMGEGGGPAPARTVSRCALPSCAPATIEVFDHRTPQGLAEPYAITLAGNDVYLAAWPDLVRCPKAGCATGAVVVGKGAFVSVAVDEASIYAAFYGWAEVTRCPLTGCGSDPEVLATGIAAFSVVVDERHLYIADHDLLGRYTPPEAEMAPPRLLRCPLTGCEPSGATVLEEVDVSPYALAEAGDRLYFTNVSHGTVISRRK